MPPSGPRLGAALLLITVMALGVRPTFAQGPAEAAPEPPNIVVILADDLGYTDVNPYTPHDPYAAHKQPFYETPHIDRLAQQGMLFTDAYASAANCAPTRAALLTGQSYPRQPIYTVDSGARGQAAYRALRPPANAMTLPPETITLAERLRAAGYATGFIGKWHLGDPPAEGPRQHGFDVNVGGYHAGHPEWPGGYFQPDNNPQIDSTRFGEYLTDYLARRASDFIRAHRDEPFYLQLSHYAPHGPLQVPDARAAKYRAKPPANGHDNADYAALIEALDRSVGRVLRTVDEAGLTDNTIVVFTSDNGGNGGYRSIGLDENGFTDNAPLKGGKGSFYEGGIRVPLLVRWPRRVAPGSASTEPAISLDLYPTLLDAAGVAPPAGYVLDGQSLLPVLTGADATLDREALYWHFPGYLEAFEPGRWRTTPVSVIRAGPWKLLHFYEDDRRELYHLGNDLGERRDVADERPAVRHRLHRQLTRWLETMDAPLPQRLQTQP
jgi:arylsulfatase A-like enzyme